MGAHAPESSGFSDHFTMLGAYAPEYDARGLIQLIFVFLFYHYESYIDGYVTKWLIIDDFAVFSNQWILIGKWVDMSRII